MKLVSRSAESDRKEPGKRPVQSDLLLNRHGLLGASRMSVYRGARLLATVLTGNIETSATLILSEIYLPRLLEV